MSTPDLLEPLPDAGRRFAIERKVRLSDVTTSGRMRLDAIARYLQDAATDDVADAGLDEPAWVVRRTLIRVASFPRFLEPVTVTTFCWSMGSRFAERRTQIHGANGSRLDTLTLWVRLDPKTGRPTNLAENFRQLYRVAVADRRTKHQLRHEALDSDRIQHTPTVGDWPLRTCDYDLHGHINNAVFWTAIEERLAHCPEPDRPRSYEMEFRLPVDSRAALAIHSDESDQPRRLWLCDAERSYASACIWDADAATTG